MNLRIVIGNEEEYDALCSTYIRDVWLVQVRIVLEGADKFNNLIGSVHYQDGDNLVDLSLELVKHVSGAHSAPSPSLGAWLSLVKCLALWVGCFCTWKAVNFCSDVWLMLGRGS